MKLIGHQHYSVELITNIWLTFGSLLLGSLMMDGGVVGCIAVITSMAFGAGALLPMLRRNPNHTDRLYLQNGFPVVLGLIVLIAPFIWHIKGKF